MKNKCYAYFILDEARESMIYQNKKKKIFSQLTNKIKPKYLLDIELLCKNNLGNTKFTIIAFKTRNNLVLCIIDWCNEYKNVPDLYYIKLKSSP